VELIKPIVELFKVLFDFLKWVVEGGARRRILALVALLMLLIPLYVISLSEQSRSHLWSEVWPWLSAVQSTKHVPLSDQQQRLLASRIGYLRDKVKDEFADHFDQSKLKSNSSRYTAWTLAQCALALADDPEVVLAPERLAAFVRDRSRQLSSCDCWQEFTTDQSSPQHILISSWIVYALARHRQAPTLREVQFLQETQDGTGGWTMFPMPYGVVADVDLPRPQGSSFATSWAVLALHEILKRDLIKDEAAREDIKRRAKHGVQFFLDNTNREAANKLWTLYPGWRGATRVSLGTSGLAIFALHRYLDEIPAPDKEPYEESLKQADQALLNALPSPVPPLDAADGYNLKLPYKAVAHTAAAGLGKKKTAPVAAVSATPETRIDSVQSLVLPWLLIGLQDAYANGTYLQRVKALKFLQEALVRIDTEFDAALKQQYWMAPELLIALRYLREPNYLRRG
jgi:hypothetical protein